MEVEIKPCLLHDYFSIKKLLAQLWPDWHWEDEKMQTVYRKALRSKNQIYLKAEAQGEIIGFCSLSKINTLYGRGELMHIDELIIDENYRNRGVGNIFLEHVVKVAQKRGCTLVELESALHRHEAHKFYENRGFQKMGYVFLRKLE